LAGLTRITRVASFTVAMSLYGTGPESCWSAQGKVKCQRCWSSGRLQHDAESVRQLRAVGPGLTPENCQ
jgi:hypothetical protein